MALEFSDEESLTASLSSPVELFSDEDMLLKSSVSDFDNDSVGAEQTPILESGVELDRYSIREVSPDMASEACDSADGTFVSGHCIVGGKYGLASSNSSLRNGRSDYILSRNCGASFSESDFCKPHYFTSKSSAENGSSEDQQIDLVRDSEKFGFNLWLENREEHVEMNNTYQWYMDNPEAFCITGSNSTPKANILESLSLDFREIDSTSVGGESEAFNPLADLTGDYDSNIRSLLRAQLCHGFALSAAPVVQNPPSSSSRIQNKSPWDIVRQSISRRENEFSQLDSHIMSTDHIMHAGVDSALLGTAFHFEGTQRARGTGTYFPHMVLYCFVLLLLCLINFQRQSYHHSFLAECFLHGEAFTMEGKE